MRSCEPISRRESARVFVSNSHRSEAACGRPKRSETHLLLTPISIVPRDGWILIQIPRAPMSDIKGEIVNRLRKVELSPGFVVDGIAALLCMIILSRTVDMLLETPYSGNIVNLTEVSFWSCRIQDSDFGLWLSPVVPTFPRIYRLRCHSPGSSHWMSQGYPRILKALQICASSDSRGSPRSSLAMDNGKDRSYTLSG